MTKMDKFWRVIHASLHQADVVLEILDARNPLETRNPVIEKLVNDQGNHMSLVLNKADLVPQEVVKRW